MNHLKSMVLRSFLTSWKFRWTALAISWLVAIAGWSAIYAMHNQYEAKTRIFVDADAVLTPLLHGLAIDSSTMSNVEMLQRTLLSEPNVENLISKTDFDIDMDGIEHKRLIEKLQQTIAITPQPHNLFTISYRDTNPERAYNVVKTLIAIFIEKAVGNNRESMENAEVFIGKQINSYEAKLRAAEKRRADFRARFMDVLPDNFNGGLSHLEVLHGQIEDQKSAIEDQKMKLDLLQKEFQKTPQFISAAEATAIANAHREEGPMQVIPDPNPALTEAKLKLEELRLRFTDDYPDVVAQKRLIRMLAENPPKVRLARVAPPGGDANPESKTKAAHDARDGANKTEKTGPQPGRNEVPNPEYEHLHASIIDQSALITTSARHLELEEKELAKLEDILQREPMVGAEFQDLDRDYMVIQHNYEQLLDRREQLHLAAAADQDAEKIKLQIIDPPTMPRFPVAPNRKLLAIGVMIAALGAGGAVSFLLGQLNGTVMTIDDAKDFGAMVLGGISARTANAGARAMNMLLFSGGLMSLLLVGALITIVFSHIHPVHIITHGK